VQLAAAEAAGRLGAADTSDTFLALAGVSNTAMVAASPDSLRRLNDQRAVPAATNALKLRENQSAAIEYLKVFGTPDQVKKVVRAAAQNPDSEFQRNFAQTLVEWQKLFKESDIDLQNAIAAIHGHSGQPLAWHVSGPLSPTTADRLLERLRQSNVHGLNPLQNFDAAIRIANGATPTLNRKRSSNTDADSVWVAWTPVQVATATNIGS
jgi:hypothetical protein